MKKIKEFKIALLEKEKVQPKKNKGKTNFIKKSSATIKLQEIFKLQNIGEDDYEDTTLFIVSQSYNELNKQNKDNIDSVGLFITFDDDTTIDNAMSLKLLEDIKTYSQEEINPIEEFFKMTAIGFEEKNIDSESEIS